MTPQCKKVLETLSDHEFHNRIDLAANLFIIDIPTRIWELKHKHDIEIEKEMRPYNGGSEVAFYRLKRKEPVQSTLGIDAKYEWNI